MTFTFETLPLENKEILRQGILKLYDRDIATVSCSFSSRNYIFIFGEGCFPAIIRVGAEMPHCKVEDVLSELLWVDDLKNDIPNVCQPLPSVGNRLVERIEVGKAAYLVTMFCKANGAIFPDSQWDAAYFYNAGVLLGQIHCTSNQGYERGFRYKRKHWDALPFYNFSQFDAYFAPSVRKDADAVLQRIKSIPRDPRWYGMIHGNFQNANLFCNWGKLWAFDFDNCCYGHFMFDVACFIHVIIHSPTYAAACQPMTNHDRLLAENGILAQFRAGYATAYQLPDEQWNLFHDFFRLRVAQATNIQIMYKFYPKDVLSAFLAPSCAYLKDDKLPVDRMEEIQLATKNCLTPEQMKIVAGYIKHAMG